MIAKEVAFSLAEGKTTYEKCISANTISKINGGDILFSGSDLAAIGLLEYTQGNCNEREKDLIRVWTTLEECHREVHISFKVMKEMPLDHNKAKVELLVESLTRLDLLNLLGDVQLIDDYLSK